MSPSGGITTLEENDITWSALNIVPSRAKQRWSGAWPGVATAVHAPAVSPSAIAALLEHRLRREESIASLIRTAPHTARAIVTALYVPLDPRLVRAAEASVTAHLWKLRAEGRAAESEGMWRAT